MIVVWLVFTCFHREKKKKEQIADRGDQKIDEI